MARKVNKNQAIVNKPKGYKKISHIRQAPVQSIPVEPIRKRGRPKKQSRANIIEISSNEQYTVQQQEALRQHLRKAKQLFKINSLKTLMWILYDIRKYIHNSIKYGTLELPFEPSSRQIEKGMVELFREIH